MKRIGPTQFTKLFLGAGLFLIPGMPRAVLPALQNAPPTVLISEFMASNRTGVEDEDGDRSDWIELVNTGSETVDLAGWSLTDSRNEPRRWVFPERLLAPGSYLVVFASGKDRRSADPDAALHTNFKLDAEGERLLIYSADDPPRMVAGFTPSFPPQSPDVSFGLDLASNQWHYYAKPTPGDSNEGARIVQLGSETRLSIESPEIDEVVSGQVQISGAADTPDFQKWQLELLPDADASRADLLEVDTTPAPVETRLDKLDTRDLPDGVHSLRLRAVRNDGNYAELIVPFVVANIESRDSAPPIPTRSVLTHPLAGAEVAGTVQIAGTVAPQAMVRWDLLLVPSADAQGEIWLSSGTTPGEFAVPLNTTLIENGPYAVSLRMVRADSNYDEVVVDFVVANAPGKAESR